MYKLLDFKTPVVNPCFCTRVLPKGPCIRTSRDIKICTNYLVSISVVNSIFLQGTFQKRTRPSPELGRILGRVCSSRLGDGRSNGKLHPFHIGGNLASHPRPPKAELFMRVQVFFTAPYFFSCTKNENTRCPLATILTLGLHASMFSRNEEQLRTPKKSVGENGTVTGGNDSAIQWVPEVDGASGNRGECSCDEWVPAAHKSVSAMQYEKLATKKQTHKPIKII